MKFYYPKYLRVNPSFAGLTVLDLTLLLTILFIASTFNLSAGKCLGLIALSIAISKIVTLKYPRGHFQLYYLKRSILDWRNDLLRLIQGVLV